jgi:hypothetical protein
MVELPEMVVCAERQSLSEVSLFVNGRMRFAEDNEPGNKGRVRVEA